MKTNNLRDNYPEIADEWHPSKNGDLKPEDVTIGSHIKAWWLGKCGHEWDAVIKDRVRGYGCPICAGKRVIVGVNDLNSVDPKLVEQWDYTMNWSNRQQTQVTYNEFKGDCNENRRIIGHPWPAAPGSRVCPC